MDKEAVWKEYKETGSEDLKENLILYYAPLVRGLAKGMHLKLPRTIEYADLVSYGFLGLLDAIDRFNLDKGIDFKVYAKVRINGAIIDGIRSEKRLPRSVQEKARKLNHAHEVLAAQLRRFPEEEEVAEYLGIEIDKYRQNLLDIGNSYVLSLDDLMSSSDKGGWTSESTRFSRGRKRARSLRYVGEAADEWPGAGRHYPTAGAREDNPLALLL